MDENTDFELLNAQIKKDLDSMIPLEYQKAFIIFRGFNRCTWKPKPHNLTTGMVSENGYVYKRGPYKQRVREFKIMGSDHAEINKFLKEAQAQEEGDNDFREDYSEGERALIRSSICAGAFGTNLRNSV